MYIFEKINKEIYGIKETAEIYNEAIIASYSNVQNYEKYLEDNASKIKINHDKYVEKLKEILKNNNIVKNKKDVIVISNDKDVGTSNGVYISTNKYDRFEICKIIEIDNNFNLYISLVNEKMYIQRIDSEKNIIEYIRITIPGKVKFGTREEILNTLNICFKNVNNLIIRTIIKVYEKEKDENKIIKTVNEIKDALSLYR